LSTTSNYTWNYLKIMSLLNLHHEKNLPPEKQLAKYKSACKKLKTQHTSLSGPEFTRAWRSHSLYNEYLLYNRKCRYRNSVTQRGYVEIQVNISLIQISTSIYAVHANEWIHFGHRQMEKRERKKNLYRILGAED